MSNQTTTMKLRPATVSMLLLNFGPEGMDTEVARQWGEIASAEFGVLSQGREVEQDVSAKSKGELEVSDKVLAEVVSRGSAITRLVYDLARVKALARKLGWKLGEKSVLRITEELENFRQASFQWDTILVNRKKRDAEKAKESPQTKG